MRRSARLAVLAAGLLSSATAQAGRTRYGWLYDTEAVPERGVELEAWVQEEDGKGGEDKTLFWWAPVIGLTDQLELALPVEATFTTTASESSTQIERFGAELRWLLTNPDPVEAGPFGALLRLGVKRLVVERKTARIEGGVVASVNVGRVHLAADLGGNLEIDDSGDSHTEIHPSAGVSIRAAGELRLGGEVFTELQVGDSDEESWVAVGPDFSFTHGRWWLSGAFLVGVTGIDAAPRLNWAVAF